MINHSNQEINIVHGTHRPLCSTYIGTTTTTTTTNRNDKVCVFTDATRGPKWLSLITTPEQAAKAAALFHRPIARAWDPKEVEQVSLKVVDITYLERAKGWVASYTKNSRSSIY